jgi:hypothetical protein
MSPASAFLARWLEVIAQTHEVMYHSLDLIAERIVTVQPDCRAGPLVTTGDHRGMVQTTRKEVTVYDG